MPRISSKAITFKYYFFYQKLYMFYSIPSKYTD